MPQSERPLIPEGLSEEEHSKLMDELLDKYPAPDEDFNFTLEDEEEGVDELETKEEKKTGKNKDIEAEEEDDEIDRAAHLRPYNQKIKVL